MKSVLLHIINSAQEEQNISVFSPFSSNQQVYIDYHPEDDNLGSLWCMGGFEVRRGKLRPELRPNADATFLNIIRGRYQAELAAGNLADLPAPGERN